jgi:hypothetical protein
MEEYNRNFDELGEDLYKELVLQMTDLKDIQTFLSLSKKTARLKTREFSVHLIKSEKNKYSFFIGDNSVDKYLNISIKSFVKSQSLSDIGRMNVNPLKHYWLTIDLSLNFPITYQCYLKYKEILFKDIIENEIVKFKKKSNKNDIFSPVYSVIIESIELITFKINIKDDMNFPVLDLEINPYFDDKIEVSKRCRMLFDYRYTPLKYIYSIWMRMVFILS